MNSRLRIIVLIWIAAFIVVASIIVRYRNSIKESGETTTPLAADSKSAVPQVILTWDPLSGAETNLVGYNAYRTIDPLVAKTLLNPVLIPISAAPSYDDKTVLPSTTYYYDVRAVSLDGGLSLASNTLTVVTNGPPIPPVGTFTITCSSTGLLVRTTWEAVPGATEYLLRIEGEDGKFLVYDDHVTNLFYEATAPSAGRIWRGYVHALVNGVIGPSTGGNTMCVPSAPLNLRGVQP